MCENLCNIEQLTPDHQSLAFSASLLHTVLVQVFASHCGWTFEKKKGVGQLKNISVDDKLANITLLFNEPLSAWKAK